jgi:two-component system alkaline phosphatase synthesis response regulator PhoP
MARILVVEDEADIALVLEGDLKLEGYETEVVADGETAARRAQEEKFDVILLDVMLPRKDGFQVCRELRHAGVRTPIILLTAKAQAAEKVMGLDLGADDYVTKPFNPWELRARIRAVLRRAEGELPKHYRFGDVDVDFGRCEVRRQGRPAGLTALEFKLLSAFIRARGRLLTREQLLEQVWERGVSLSDRVVDNHIANLRKKIEPDPVHPRYLVSVRALGYRFEG